MLDCKFLEKMYKPCKSVNDTNAKTFIVKECIFINRFIGKVILTSILILSLASPISAQGMCPSFRLPNSRVVINNSYEGIHFIRENDALYVPVRLVFEYLGANVFWCNEELLSIEYDGDTYTPDFLLRYNRSYVNAKFLYQIAGYYIELLECINALKISDDPSTLTPETLVRKIPTFYDYTEEDLHWMARIIHAEARGEPYDAMLAVGNVVLNRMAHPSYPDTVRGVIFDRNHGVQFTPTVNGAINNTPSVASFLAAVEVLEGRQNAEDVLFFKNPSIARNTWISRNRQFAFTIHNQDFFF